MTTLDTRNTRGPDVEPPERRRWSRKKIIAVLVAALVGLPAIALAATYLFGLISGQTFVANSDASITITAVRGSSLITEPNRPAPGGVDCSSSTFTPGTGQQGLSLYARAFRVTVNGQTPSPTTMLGYCTIEVDVANAANGAPAQVSAVLDALPVGWTPVITNPTPSLAGGATQTITIKLTADGTAVGDVNATVPNFTGKLNVTIPPAGAGSA